MGFLIDTSILIEHERGRLDLEPHVRRHGVGELHMLAPMRRFDGEWGTRLAWLHHGISQEMYHRGQLCTYQRLMGQVPALTQRIRGDG